MTRHDATRSLVRGPSGPGAICGSAGLRVALLVGIAACRESSAGTPFSPSPGGPTPAPSVHVQGNALVDSAGRRVRLRGVSRSGTEYACAQGWGIFDGPSDTASVRAIASWNATAVRVPLNETCWLGINGVKPAYSGATYQKAIGDYVATLNAAGLVAILDLHWTAAGTGVANGQQPMPDQDHTPEFWRQVATAFGHNDAVVFDLFNEPYPDNNSDTPEAWRCWRDGGTCTGVSFPAAGMQELMDVVRRAGATNVIILGGVQYAAGLSQWLASEPHDSLHNVAASWHIYNFSWCNTLACWNATADTVSKVVPLVLGELGENDRGSAFVTSLMDWMDARQGSYLAWVWDTWPPPGDALDLITSYDGTPSSYGATFKARFAL